jgi:hypothetical protein
MFTSSREIFSSMIPDSFTMTTSELPFVVMNCVFYICGPLQGAQMRGCSGQFMRVLATKLHEEFFRPGELLLKQGDVSFQLLFLTVRTVHMYFKIIIIIIIMLMPAPVIVAHS